MSSERPHYFTSLAGGVTTHNDAHFNDGHAPPPATPLSRHHAVTGIQEMISVDPNNLVGGHNAFGPQYLAPEFHILTLN